jgi:signal transduction histidine kinase
VSRYGGVPKVFHDVEFHGELDTLRASIEDMVRLLADRYLELARAKEVAENAVRVKARFLDIAAHELRTPVTGFSLLVQLTRMKLERGQAVDVSALVQIQTQADRLSHLVVDLLDASRLDRGTMSLKNESTDIACLVSECLDSFRLLAPNRPFVFSKPEQVLEIDVDKTRIYQVLSNLLDNAIKYTPDNTPVEVIIDFTPTHARVSVKDHGAGIPEKLQANLFGLFERGTGEREGYGGGMGLGLFISRRIIELHGGTLGVVSKVGAGSTFFFDLPRNVVLRKAI